MHSSNCGAITVVNGSRFVFNITPIDVNSIPPSSGGHSESLGSTAPSAYQKRTNNRTAKSAHQNVHIQTIILDPVYFYIFLLLLFVIFMMDLRGYSLLL